MIIKSFKLLISSVLYQLNSSSHLIKRPYNIVQAGGWLTA